MAKLIIIAVAIWLVITVLKRYRKNLQRPDNANHKTPGASESMVQCAHCGVHLPLSESVESDGRHYCSAAHIRKPDDESGH
jgi:uncharacterized protein